MTHPSALVETPGPESPLESQSRPVAALSILACADESVLAKGASRLAAAGLPVQRAHGWGEALALAREMRPSAVLLDSGFLEGAGPELCGALRRAWGSDETPVLALCRGSREVTRALSAGASDVVEKPIDWDLVERRLRTLATIRHTRAELEHNRRALAEAHVALAQGLRQFEQSSLIDSLTGLPNRFQIERILERAILADAGPVALMTIDLDRFSEWNETLGRRAGDEILRIIGERLSGCLWSWPGRSGAGPGIMSAARLGGAEFAVMLQGSDEERLGGLAHVILEALGKSLSVAGKDLHLTASIGVAIAAGRTVVPETLLRHAETAMYEARRGGAPYCFYSREISVTAETRRNMDQRLRSAFERGALEVHYQPVLAASSRRILSVEALLRWSDGDRGFVPPSEFIPVAESMGLMSELGVWVLETACRQLRSWMDDGLPPLRVAVNVTRGQLEFGDFAAEVGRVLREAGLDPSLLELELNERGALRRDPEILAQMRRLKALGVRLVVDNFGTGETPVGHLRAHELHGLKIDGSFVRAVAHDAGPSLTAAMAGLGRQLGMHVVAECVETEAQLARMVEYGCDAVQGFLFSKAVPAEQLRRRMTLSPGRPGVCELAVAS